MKEDDQEKLIELIKTLDKDYKKKFFCEESYRWIYNYDSNTYVLHHKKANSGEYIANDKELKSNVSNIPYCSGNFDIQIDEKEKEK